MKIRTLDQLAGALEDDLRWRKKELTTLKFMFENRRHHQGDLLLRVAICLLYAHWEGAVKQAATSYVSFVAHRGLRYQDLTPNFVALGLRREIQNAGRSNCPSIHTRLAERLMSDLSDSAKINWQDSVNTRSNLNFETFEEILALLGLNNQDYLSKGKLLDEKLLKNRNQIAHGKQVSIDPDAYDLLHTEVIDLADRFSTDIQNAAATEKFRRAPV